MNRTPWPWLVLTAAGAAGCGGDDDAGPTWYKDVEPIVQT